MVWDGLQILNFVVLQPMQMILFYYLILLFFTAENAKCVRKSW